MPAAVEAMQHAAQLSANPHLVLVKLGYLYLSLRQPDHAVNAFDEAARRTPWGFKPADNPTFAFMLAQGRSGAWDALGDLEKATSYQEEAAQLEPDVPAPGNTLKHWPQSSVHKELRRTEQLSGVGCQLSVSCRANWGKILGDVPLAGTSPQATAAN